jgi:hypothetical protein
MVCWFGKGGGGRQYGNGLIQIELQVWQDGGTLSRVAFERCDEEATMAGATASQRGSCLYDGTGTLPW